MNVPISIFPGLLLFLTYGKLIAAEPLPPLDLKLNPEIIQPLGIHPKVDVLLVFPEEVTLILGQGLTDGEAPGQVQFQQGEKNPKLITLRQLDLKADVVMQVVLKEQVFVFRIRTSERPPTTVRFSFDPAPGDAEKKAREISKEEAEKMKRPVSKDRIKQMANLVGREPILRAKLPEAYLNYESREVDFSSPQSKGLVFHVRRIARFTDEDTLIFFGELQNQGKSPYRPSPTLATLKVGPKQTFAKTTLLHTSKNIPAGKAGLIWVALVGDGNGKPLHLSLKNDFSIQLNP